MLLKKIKSPVIFQGDNKRKDYFEGWYYKQVSEDEKSSICFIPGVSFFNEDVHSFVQYIFVGLNENQEQVVKTGYVRYSIKDFKFNHNPFMVQIGDNIFTESKVKINLSDKNIIIEGELNLGVFTQIRKSVLMPNIMGPFAYIPKMECYHGVISMNHGVNGSIKINDEKLSFNYGKGYIEKDWGSSFPKKYIWIQCNGFKNKSTSVFCSIAHIPFMKGSFLGFICNLVVNGEEFRFATYNGSKFKIETITNEKVIIVLENSKGKLKIEADLKEGGELIAPKGGKMSEKIKEESSGDVKISLYCKDKEGVYEDKGQMAGIEVVGFQ